MAHSMMLGVRIGTATLEELVARSRAAIVTRTSSFVFACANPHSLVVARTDEDFRAALNTASAVVADGVGCQVGSKLAGAAVGPRITGSDYFVAVMKDLERTGGRAFLFGSSEDVLAKLQERMRRDFPTVSLQALSPPYRPWSAGENEEMVRVIQDFAPDVLWVGMTAPKQEKWVAANASALQVPVIGSIGAVFDYYAGVTQRAPEWICRLGFEWLYRLPREPRRLWRRTFVSAPAFLWWAAAERFGRVVR